MLQANLSKLVGCVLGAFLLAVSTGGQETPPQFRHLGSADRDATMRCITSVYGKPVLWDRIGTNLLIQPCPATRAELADGLTKRGIRIFDAQDFMYVIPEKLFQFFDQPQELYPGGPVQAWPTLKWSSITVHLNVQKWSKDEDLPAKASEIANQILQQARMIPLAVSGGPGEGFPNKGAVDADVNIAIWQGSLGPAGEQSVVACINGRGRTEFSTARLVYGELRDGKYVMLWDSPLFNILHGNIYFGDINADGWKEFLIESSNYGNHEYPMLVIFDHEGHEITRQKRCDTAIAADANFIAEDGTCAIFGEDVDFSNDVNFPADPEEAAKLPQDIYVTSWDGDGRNHVFKLVDGIYVPGPPIDGAFPPPPPTEKTPTAAEVNEQGLKLIQQRDYSKAVTTFMFADRLAYHKNAEYANNVGFALYKAARYQASVDWLNMTIRLDPKRAVAYLNLGDALAKLNRNPEARDAYEKYLELAPNSKAAPDVKEKLATLPLKS
jgi:Tetratricopeptide repeat